MACLLRTLNCAHTASAVFFFFLNFFFPPLAPTHPDRIAETLPLLLKRKCFCKHGAGDAFSPVLVFFCTNSALLCPFPTRRAFPQTPAMFSGLLSCLNGGFLLPSGSVLLHLSPPVSPIFHLLISRLHQSFGEERRTLSSRCRPRRLLLCRLAQSCLATLAAAGCYISPLLTKRVGVWSGYPEEIGCLQMVCYVTRDG